VSDLVDRLVHIGDDIHLNCRSTLSSHRLSESLPIVVTMTLEKASRRALLLLQLFCQPNRSNPALDSLPDAPRQ
jgi:hypothetical protein